ncbi:MAG: hypothetical protein CMO55_26840 [Verrucomicrobiales bacterium]|nr:hypothetical protein [Verrucomicrobiales bacterium]
MQVNSVTVRNYRIHKDLTVELSDSLTLIGGPNESGKSTLMEAAHRALFLKASAGGELQKEMVSDRHSGHPEVEVTFTIGGSRYSISKRFSGSSGKATLREDGGATLHNAEAETRLAELLGVEDPTGKRVNSKSLEGQWAHLWISQGRSGDDPSEESVAHRDALLARLKDQGGGVVMQSDNDARVANRIEEEYSKIFTGKGKVKAGTVLDNASKEKDQAEYALTQAEEDFRNLEQAISNYEAAERTITRQSSEIEQLRADQKECEKSLELAGELERSLEKVVAKHRAAVDDRDRFEQAIADVSAMQQEADALGKQLQPVTGRIEELSHQLTEAKAKLGSREQEISAARQSLTKARNEQDLLHALATALDCEARLADLVSRQKEIVSIETKITESRDRLSGLQKVSRQDLAALQKLEASRSELTGILRALATGIEVTKANGAVTIGDETLGKGDKHVIDSETVLKAGDDFEFRITPGGGTRIAETRQQLSEVEDRRDSLLQSIGVTSADEAQLVLQERETIENQLREYQTDWNARRPEELKAAIEDLSHRAKTARAEVERKSTGDSLPETVAETRELLEARKAESTQLSDQVETLGIEQNSAIQVADQTERKLLAEQQGAKEVENRLLELKAQIKIKEEPLGNSEKQAERLRSLTEACDVSASEVASVKEQLDQLQPSALLADRDRYSRALQQCDEQIKQALQQRAVASNELSKSKGSFDPASQVAVAKANAENATQRYQRLERRAAAIQLLHQRFTEEQQRLSERFSQPLAEKASGYLQQVFGSTARATVTMTDGVPGGWTISREGETFEFDKLSGGTKEQLAAAIRLAIAEILAADHGGKLPIVFDDAFTYSDPDRTRNLQRMLDHAARQGLQVILLTCDPAEYVGLGARTVSLG